MNNELTKVDIQKMQDEIDYRKTVLRPKLIEDVQIARGFGDLSENFEYKAAKQEKNRNESRIRYLERMIRTAVLVSAESSDDTVGLFDKVEVYFEEDDEVQEVQLVTMLRQDALNGLISKESPLGSALFGHRVGDRVTVVVNDLVSYPVVIRAIEKGTDDESLAIRSY